MDRKVICWPARIKKTAIGSGLAAFLIGAATACAQMPAWQPDRTIELVAASGAGGGTDRLARTIQKIFEEQRLAPVPVTVVNKPGGNQTIARAYLNQHSGDAHYVEISNPTLLSNSITGLTEQRHTDFTPIALLIDEYTVFTVAAGAPVGGGRDLIEGLKKDPMSISIGITTRGGANHIALISAFKASGTDTRNLKIVSFRSNAESATALLGGHIQLVASSVAPVMPHVLSGKVRIIAVSSPRRLGGPLAGVPTWREQGVDIVNSNWRGIIGPKGLAPAQIAFWEQAVSRLVSSEYWKEGLRANYWESHYLPGSEFGKFLDAEYGKMKEALAEVGLVK